MTVLPDLPAAGRLRVVIDTDTDNEIDDQFALVYALLSPERLTVEAVYAAPYHNDRSSGPADGMHRSRAEIDRVLDRLQLPDPPPAYDGATGWLTGGAPQRSAATDDLIVRAREGDGRLYVVAIGAATNIASALLLEPAITDRITVVWLGGNPTWWGSAREFNLAQDPDASALLFDSGVDLVHVPCINVTEHLRTTRPEIDQHVRPAGPVGAYLAAIFDDRVSALPGASTEIWDLGPVAWLIDPSGTRSSVRTSPRLVRDGDDFRWLEDSRRGGEVRRAGDSRWSRDVRRAGDMNGAGRHEIREVSRIDRDRVFADLFAKLAAYSATTCR